MRSSNAKYAIYNNITETIGRTPVVRLNHLAPKNVNVFAKLEYFNPLGSVKDRLALSIINTAEQNGTLKPGQTVVELTSGNTGIGLAMVCAAKGYPLVVVMAESFSVERRKTMRALGAKVVLTPAPAKGTGMFEKVDELVKEHGWFYANQFTTGSEIMSDFAGRPLDWFVTGWGTGGTYSGVSRALRAGRPGVKIALCEPDNAALVTSGKEQVYTHDIPKSHEAWTPHPIQGWTPDFVTKVLDEALTHNYHDKMFQVVGKEGIDTALKLARKEGIYCGISGGATVAAALRLAEQVETGSTILAMVPDTGERYLSSPMFETITAEMNEAELEISKSTPSHHVETQQ